eukprot:567177_1
MPQNQFIVASRGPAAVIYIWVVSKHLSFPAEAENSNPPMPQGVCVCVGHQAEEGYGMCWLPHKTGMLLKGSEDKTVALWDVNAAIGSSSSSMDDSNLGVQIYLLVYSVG